MDYRTQELRLPSDLAYTQQERARGSGTFWGDTEEEKIDFTSVLMFFPPFTQRRCMAWSTFYGKDESNLLFSVVYEIFLLGELDRRLWS